MNYNMLIDHWIRFHSDRLFVCCLLHSRFYTWLFADNLIFEWLLFTLQINKLIKRSNARIIFPEHKRYGLVKPTYRSLKDVLTEKLLKSGRDKVWMKYIFSVICKEACKANIYSFVQKFRGPY